MSKNLYSTILQKLTSETSESNSIMLWNIYQDQVGNRQIFESTSDEIMERFDSFRHFLRLCNGYPCGILENRYFSLFDDDVFTFDSIGDLGSPYNANELAKWLVSEASKGIVSLSDWFTDLPEWKLVSRTELFNLIRDDHFDISILDMPERSNADPLTHADRVLEWWSGVVEKLLAKELIKLSTDGYSIVYFVEL